MAKLIRRRIKFQKQTSNWGKTFVIPKANSIAENYANERRYEIVEILNKQK